MEEGSDVLSFSPVLTGDGQEEPSLPRAVLTVARMGVQYKAEGAAYTGPNWGDRQEDRVTGVHVQAFVILSLVFIKT